MRRDCRLKSNESYESVFSSCASSSLYTIVRVYENSIQPELKLYQEFTNRLIRHSPRFYGFRFFLVQSNVRSLIFNRYTLVRAGAPWDRTSRPGRVLVLARPISFQFVLRMGRGRAKFQTLRTRRKLLVRALKESGDPQTREIFSSIRNSYWTVHLE